MDVAAVRAGLAAAAATIPGLHTHPRQVRDLTEPAFVVAGYTVEFDETADRGADELLFTCQVFVSGADDRCQDELDGYLAGSGPTSIKAALEADQTLGGVCDWVRVERVSGYGEYEIASSRYYGAVLSVAVGGEGAS